MYRRTLQKKIEKSFFKGKAIIIYGARQVGKTTLIKEIQKKFRQNSLFLNCDEPDVRANLTNVTSTQLKHLTGNSQVVFIDEAQNVRNIGLTLKLMVDTIPKVQVVATGSSSLDLSDEIIEPLTGRKYEYQLYPLSFAELSQKHSSLELKRVLEKRIVFGMYPEIVQKPEEDISLLRSLATSYLYKDVLKFQDIRRSELLEKLLTALALQIGNEVSYNELANSIGAAKQTIANYIQLLEKSFVVFRLSPYSRNIRNEISKFRKIYFYDTGIRNALINNLNPLSMRQDKGALWENFMISERLKYLQTTEYTPNTYFWRTHRQQEIDYIEEYGGKISAFEFKWSSKKHRIPKTFIETYPQASYKIITKEDFNSFIDLT